MYEMLSREQITEAEKDVNSNEGRVRSALCEINGESTYLIYTNF